MTESSASPNRTPPSGDATIASELRTLLLSRRWSLARPNGDLRSPLVRFKDDCRIEGYTHPNEAGWDIRGGRLVFHTADGTATSISQTVTRADDGSFCISLVIPGPDCRPAHHLREVISFRNKARSNAFSKEALVRSFALGLQYGHRHTDPFLHYIYRPFPHEIYAELLRHMPDNAAFIELRHGDALRADGSSTRLVLPFSKPEIMRNLTAEQREFWAEINDILCSDDIRALYMEAFAAVLTERFKCPLSEVIARPKLFLLRDLASYKINVHPDAEWKTITAQFYLTPDYSQHDIGTGIYKREPDGKFSEAHRVEFSPGNAYCFCVTKNSWHGVKPLDELPRPRNSLMLTYFNREGFDY